MQIRAPTYLSLLYMLLALVTGIVYFVFATTGLSLSIGFAILIIGVPFFLLFVGISRVIALAEGRIVEMLKDPRTSGTLVYLLAMLPLGVFYFTFAVVGLAVSIATLVAPIVVLLYHAGLVQIDGTIQGPHPALLPFVSIAGFLLLTVTLHLARGIGYLHGQLAKTLLVQARRND
ncbi:MAG: sensor domain-containing protein [Steroidobacteraceae bacterium]